MDGEGCRREAGGFSLFLCVCVPRVAASGRVLVRGDLPFLLETRSWPLPLLFFIFSSVLVGCNS